MVLVTVECVDQRDGDSRTCDRVLRGIMGLEQSGYTVERYERFNSSALTPQKRILAITRNDGANDTEFEAWLRSLTGK